jgi:hypothetical protein
MPSCVHPSCCSNHSIFMMTKGHPDYCTSVNNKAASDLQFTVTHPPGTCPRRRQTSPASPSHYLNRPQLTCHSSLRHCRRQYPHNTQPLIVIMFRTPLPQLLNSTSASLSFVGGWKLLKNSLPQIFTTPPPLHPLRDLPSPHLVLVVHGIGPQVQVSIHN